MRVGLYTASQPSATLYFAKSKSGLDMCLNSRLLPLGSLKKLRAHGTHAQPGGQRRATRASNARAHAPRARTAHHVHCSPGIPLNRNVGSMMNGIPAALTRSTISFHCSYEGHCSP